MNARHIILALVLSVLAVAAVAQEGGEHLYINYKKMLPAGP